MANKVRFTQLHVLRRLKQAVRDHKLNDVLWAQLELYFLHFIDHPEMLSQLKIQDLSRLVLAMKDMAELQAEREDAAENNAFVARLAEIKRKREN
jgi:hypothetical protein|tara:strand:- start:1569 stop:1853 length:285 start_codon:yes stop_codon:yes gene_type:complete